MIQHIDTTILDNIIIGRVNPHIYAFSTGTVPNYLKVGDTYRPVNVRLDEWRKFYKDLEPLYEHSAKLEDGTIFRDYSVHEFLEHDKNRRRLEQGEFPLVYYSREFFKDATPQDIDDAIADIIRSSNEKDGKYTFYSSDYLPTEFHYKRETEPWKLRPNQADTVDRFNNALDFGRTNLLMYAVMRFGKSFTALCCAKRIAARITVVLSAKADVKGEWKKNVELPANFSNFVFLDSKSLKASDKIIDELLEEEKQVVIFLTLQDLRGKKIKEKHKKLFDNTIDLLIIDETHYGARGEEYGRILRESNLRKSQITKELKGIDTADDFDVSIKAFKYKTQLHLSGTPYRILMGDEFEKEDIVSFCQFTDIVKEQKKWDDEHLGNEAFKEWDNPYYGFPQMIRFAFTPNESSRRLLAGLREQGVTYAFSELFKPCSIEKDLSPACGHKHFVHIQEVSDLLHVIDGTSKEDGIFSFLDYDKIKNGSMCRHMVMALPFRASCDAMEKLIKSRRNDFANLKEYTILNIAGVDAKNKFPNTQSVVNRISTLEKKGKKTLTLTVNRMLTGSTVEQWDTMIYLKDTVSPQDYDQSIFRIQNQYIKTYKDGNNDTIKYNMKPQTLLVDFDPGRMFRLQELKSQFYNVNIENQGNDKLEQRIQEELDISPIIVLNHNKIKRVTPADIMDAVRAYSQNKSVLDEAVEIPIDFSLFDDPVLKGEISSMNPVDEKKGLDFKPIKDDDSEDDISIPAEPQKETDNDRDNRKADNNDDSENEQALLEKKLKAFYSQILFYSFLTDSKIASLEQLIKSLSDNDDNKRISRNIGLKPQILKRLMSRINPFVLNKLDYKIQNINSLMHDDSLMPLERAKVAVKKFTRISATEVVTPDRVVNELISILPIEEIINNKGTCFLDIASVQGEMAVALYEKFQSIKDICNKIYSLPTSPLAYELTLKMYKALGLPLDHVLSGFKSEDLLERKEDLINEIESFKPTVILGGPPFNQIDGGGRGESGSALYHKYFEIAKEFKPDYISIYMKAVWYSGGRGAGLQDFRNNMLSDQCISVLHDYPDPLELNIQGTALRGGVCLFLWDKNHKGKCTVYNHILGEVSQMNRYLRTGESDIFIRYNQGLSILKKVQDKQDKKKLDTYDKYVSNRDPFGLGDRFVGYTPFDPDKYNHELYYKLYCVKKQVGCVSKSLVKEEHRGLAGKWKVLVAKASPGDDTLPHSIISAPIVSERNSICTNGLLLVRVVNSEKEAENLRSYMISKFFRFMMILAKNGQNLTSHVFRYVPDLPLKEKWSDEKLFKYFDISDEEQEFINTVIKDVNL